MKLCTETLPLSPRECCVGLQLPRVLDELFTYGGPLGASVNGEGVSARVWAPTASQVGPPLSQPRPHGVGYWD